VRRIAVCAMIGFVLSACGCTWLDGLGSAPLLVTVAATPAQGTAPLAVRFVAERPAGASPAMGYTWDPGDGTDPFPGAALTEHIYTRPGTYTASVVVLDADGQTTEAEIAIDVINTAPIAACRLSNTAPVPGERVQYDASGSIDFDGAVVDFVWEFGDGETMRGTRVSHVYEEIGIYTVRLTITDDSGAAVSVTHDIDVHRGTGGGGGCGGRGVGL